MVEVWQYENDYATTQNAWLGFRRRQDEQTRWKARSKSAAIGTDSGESPKAEALTVPYKYIEQNSNYNKTIYSMYGLTKNAHPLKKG